MFRDNTTFIVGAGASAEFAMPVGTELAKMIKSSSLIRFDSRGTVQASDDTFYDNFVRLWPRNSDGGRLPYLAANTIQESVHTAVSIDALIDRFKDEYVSLIGKMLIALEISKAEADSSMSLKHKSNVEGEFTHDYMPQNDLKKPLINPDDTWIGHFFRILCDGIADPTELGDNIKIICFNYDRCIEYYLRRQISAAYRISLEDAHDIVMNKIKIIHPYGTLGELALSDTGYGEKVLAFGGVGTSGYLRLDEIAKNIRTYTERQHEGKVIKEIHDAVGQANVLCFLGFGFNNQNLDLLRISHLDEYLNQPPPMIYSSGYGIFPQVEETIKRRIMHLLWDDMRIHERNHNRVRVEFGQSCLDLFKIHNMNLSSFSRAYFVQGRDENSSQRVVISSGTSRDQYS